MNAPDGLEPDVTETFDDIKDTFDFLDDWEDRYRHVIEMGKALPDLDESLQVQATKVDGCARQVWIAPRIDGEGPDIRIHLDGTSDALIVRGLIAILRVLYSGKTAAEILDIDAFAAFAGLGLDQHLSAQRSNGLRAMVARIREIAERAMARA